MGLTSPSILNIHYILKLVKGIVLKFFRGGKYSSSNTNPKGKSLFAEGGKSFGVAVCSGLLKKVQNSDEYLSAGSPSFPGDSASRLSC